MNVRGINYDTGTEYRPGLSSRPLWQQADVVRDLRVIRDELACTSVNLYGTNLERLHASAVLALRERLHVSLQLRSIDETRETMLSRVRDAARVAAHLGNDGPVTLNVGCELTLFTRGFIPGKSFLDRIKRLVWLLPFFSIVNARLNRHLAEVARVARRHFRGPITYSAGAWESVEWRPFDLVGVDLYRDRWNARTYVADLRKLFRHGKPVVITEFGCATFEGAERAGGGGWMIVDFDATPPAVKPGYIRSEAVQAALLGDLLDCYVREGVHGAYVFEFVQASFPHAEDSRHDLDMAAYGLVKVRPGSHEDTSLTWQRKAGFDAVARCYRSLKATEPRSQR
jgi:hypothetical protein